MSRLMLFICLILLCEPIATAFVSLSETLGPCGVVLEVGLYRVSRKYADFGGGKLVFFGTPRYLQEMHRVGYMVRDCSYLDPFVYWRIEYLMSWHGARLACQQVPGGDLISIHNFDEKQLSNAMAENNYFNVEQTMSVWPWENASSANRGIWLGLVRNDDNSAEWTWVDDTELQYTDWLSGQNGNGRCAQIAYAVHRGELNSVSRGWQQVDCRLSMKALCKAPRMAVDP